MNGKINIRIQSISDVKMEKSISHDMRTRRDLENVDYAKSENNHYSTNPETMRHLYKAIRQKHEELHKINTGRKVRRDRTNSIQEGVITFPAIYQKHFEEGRFTSADLRKMFQKFKELFEEESGLSILSEFWHFDEKTLHVHFHATNFSVKGENLGKVYNPKGWKSHLQDIGGSAFAEIGLRRGDSKKQTRERHVTQREHANALIKNADEVEEVLSKDFDEQDITKLIKESVKPLKTMLIYIKRAMKKEQEASRIIKNERLALAKFSELFPNVQGVDDLEDLVKHIALNHRSEAQGFKPTKPTKPQM